MKLCIPKATLLGFSLAAPIAFASECPFLAKQRFDQRKQNIKAASQMRRLQDDPPEWPGDAGDGGIPEGGYEAVMADIEPVLTDSKDFWPADFGNYGGLFIRLAWHCAGSYRDSDGRGGCDGGRIRFSPELTWMDNGNLDKALQLLVPIKEKYGSKLSWGDLIVLAGTTAIKSMGGPFFGFCGGRIDDGDGSASKYLGPSDEQEAIAPCQSLVPSMQGQCLDVNGTALGPTTVGLIYVNPEGPVTATGDPAASAQDIRKAFARMGFDDKESVALIGGGHAFGKAHGPCLEPPCGEGEMQGKGENTYTAGFEGAWTTTPTVWSNQFFTNLFDFNWVNVTGPGGFIQWAPETTDGSAPPDIFMLTSDIAMIRDDSYLALSETYAGDLDQLGADFGAAWYRLMTADMGPHTRCIGNMVPEPQPFQHPLPAAPDTLPDYVPVRAKIQELIDGDDALAGAFINLAWRCANTYRATDHRGGCNGARIRFAPESQWPTNAGTADALTALEPVKQEFQDVSFADLIVLAGMTALESTNDVQLDDFCGGRVDAEDGSGSEGLQPRVYSSPVVTVRDDCEVKGLTTEECVAVMARENLSTQYFAEMQAATGEEQAWIQDEFVAVVETFATDESALKQAFVTGWTKMMTADRYLNNVENACTVTAAPAPPTEPAVPEPTAPAPTPTTAEGNATEPTASEPAPSGGSTASMNAFLCVIAVAGFALL